ncbi:MAG TPA: septum site-determining protein MinC [Candidatus Cybelea sp.]|nr:septum site-determining protein MinC [Candidatus Cybelea sp.]
MTLLRGRRGGLEVTLAPGDLEQGFADLHARLGQQPSFYRGASATVNFSGNRPSAGDLALLGVVLSAAGIVLTAITGTDEHLPALAQEASLQFEPPRGELERRRAGRPRPEVHLSEAARSLVADFAGARGDIAQRRSRGEASVRRHASQTPPEPTTAPVLRVVDAPPATLYHPATLRGGQVLHHTGNIVVVGDVNPGAELVATGDIVVFGRLAGIAHAGAQGDAEARIYALDLAPTQLRIATCIAAEGEKKRRGAPVPEAAVAQDGRIVILTLDRLDALERSKAAST